MFADLAVNPKILQVAAGTVAVMTVGTVVRLIGVRWAAPEVAKTRLDSLKTWWGVFLVILCAAMLGRSFTVFLFVAVSAAALREFFVLRRGEIGQRRVALWIYGLIPFSYLWIWLGWPGVFIAFLPLAALLVLSVGMILSGPVSGFVSAAGQAYWGLLLTTYAPAHAALLFTLPPASNPVAGGAGWFLFLLLLTEADDIAQAQIGRWIGKRKIASRISPHKTWAGFVGGILITSCLAVPLGAWLTPWGPLLAMAAGLLISLTGFCGDLNVSAIKRYCGVKDSSHLLPGQGGILDRIDSLTFAAPVFYYFVVLVNASNLAVTR